MSTVREKAAPLPPLEESFLHNFQYTLGFLDRVAFSEAIFLRAAHNLYGSLNALLAARPEVTLHSREKSVFLDGSALPDSYVLQRIFVRFRCPAIRFRRGILPPELLQCLRQMESLLRRELAPERMETPKIADLHYDWLPRSPE